ncbi:MAG: Hpt domain-containing protein, partial [Beijerinckiaceae bacterium]|nr:Hpt domain-containing protein [Beijerinckiaceae bacterium]
TRLADPDPAGLKADAHALISSAGLLGFRRLSALARALEDVIGAVSASDPETTGAVSAAQMQLLACRAETLDVVRAELDRAMSGMAPDAAARIATA